MTTAHPSGPRPLGRGKRKGAQRAYRQGDLDGLCGVYSVVNALQAVAPELDAKLSARLFRNLVRCLRGRSREPLAVIVAGRLAPGDRGGASEAVRAIAPQPAMSWRPLPLTEKGRPRDSLATALARPTALW